jgi:hypothetical protein
VKIVMRYRRERNWHQWMSHVNHLLESFHYCWHSPFLKALRNLIVMDSAGCLFDDYDNDGLINMISPIIFRCDVWTIWNPAFISAYFNACSCLYIYDWGKLAFAIKKLTLPLVRFLFFLSSSLTRKKRVSRLYWLNESRKEWGKNNTLRYYSLSIICWVIPLSTGSVKRFSWYVNANKRGKNVYK